MHYIVLCGKLALEETPRGLVMGQTTEGITTSHGSELSTSHGLELRTLHGSWKYLKGTYSLQNLHLPFTHSFISYSIDLLQMWKKSCIQAGVHSV